ncbi:hypothetical protein [Microcoleus vaginatus]|uniref:hypothetical protein n=1 Tax=Microcoleus vaginatus TaxID=119532 RepID=UPI0032A46369
MYRSIAEKTRFLGHPPIQETGFLSESVGCTEVLRKKPGFLGPAIGFLVDGRSGFLVMGDRI